MLQFVSPSGSICPLSPPPHPTGLYLTFTVCKKAFKLLVHPYSDLLPGTESIILGMFTYNQMKKHKQGKSRAPVCK